MSHSKLPDEFYRLIDALVHERMTPEQHQQLQSWLKDNAAAQAEYHACIDLHLALRRLLDNPLPASCVATPSVLPGGRRRTPWWAGSVTALALLTLIVISVTRVSQWGAVPVVKEAPATVPSQAKPAILSQIADAELFGELTPKLHSELPFGRTYTLIKGQVELTFARGATVLIQSPAVFSVDAGDVLNMKIGACSVYAPEGAEGFQVITPRSEIIDLGTRFFVDVSEMGQSEIQVIEGAAAVQAVTDHGGPPRTMTQGQAIRMNAETEQTESIAFNAKIYQRQLPDRVVSYDAIPLPGTDTVQDLKSVTVQRNGRAYTYPVNDLIGIKVLHFRAGKNRTNVAWIDQLPENPATTLEEDVALNSGLINPGGRSGNEPHLPIPTGDYHERPGMAIKFNRPVENGSGPDVVLFELQSPIYPPEGDHFRVSPLRSTPGLQDHLVKQYDITLNSKNALRLAPFRQIRYPDSPQSLQDLVTLSQRAMTNSLPSFSALAVGIDLSDLGYAQGAMVDSLFLEDAGTDEHSFDPVFIAGFPRVSSADARPAASVKDH